MIYWWSFQGGEGGIFGYGKNNAQDAREGLAERFNQTIEELDIAGKPDKVWPLSQFFFMVNDDFVDGW